MHSPRQESDTICGGGGPEEILELLAACVDGDSGAASRLLRAHAPAAAESARAASLARLVNAAVFRSSWEGASGVIPEPPLHVAAKHGHLAVCKLLLEAGADAAAVSRGGYTALFDAAWAGRDAVVQLLLQAGCPIEGANRSSALLIAVNKGHASVVSALVRGGADVLAETGDGRAPWRSAADGRQPAVAEALIYLSPPALQAQLRSLVEGWTIEVLPGHGAHGEVRRPAASA